MDHLPSRNRYQNHFSKNHLEEHREKYGAYKYRLCVFLDLADDIPRYTTIEIGTYRNGKSEKPDKEVAILSKHLSRWKKTQAIDSIKEGLLHIDDIKHFGELLFVLAAKLKYDLIKFKRHEDNSGFLHTKEIGKMNPSEEEEGFRRTYVGRSLYGTLRKIFNPEKKYKEKTAAFTDAFLFEPRQLYHLVPYIIESTKAYDESLLWWLNVQAKDVTFKDIANGKPISDSKLGKKFEELFGGCLLDPEALQHKVKAAEVAFSEGEYAKPTDQEQQKQPTLSGDPPEEVLGLHKKVLEIDKRNKNQNIFRFEYCWPPFVGRDEEMQQLYDFVDHKNENLLWWTVTGKGGTGKSRLALELCCQLEKQGWYAGFLTNTNGPDVWRRWEPQRPTLIVVDYTHEKNKELGEHLGNNYEKSKLWKHPARILFLERCQESEVLKQFCSPHRELFDNTIRYYKENKSLELKGLGDEFIDLMAGEVFSRYSDRQPCANEVKAIKELLGEMDHENRPLYAMLVADACARGEDVRRWDADKLHECVLSHSRNIWKRAGIDETNGLDKKHLNLLVLSTMTNGVDICSDQYNKCLDRTHKRLKAHNVLPAEHEFQNDKYKILCDDEVNGELSPMAPDILGEYYILQRWKGSVAEGCEMELISKTAWRYKPWGLVNFISRAATDFPTDNWLDKIVDIIRNEEGRHLEKVVLLSNLAREYSKDNFDKADKYYDYIEDIWNSGYQNNADISLVLASIAAILMCRYGEDGKIDRAVKYYDRIKDIWESGYQKDTSISHLLADTASNLTCYYGKDRNPHKAVQYYNCIEGLWSSGYQNDKDISLKLAVAALNLIIIHLEAWDFKTGIQYYNRIEELWNSGYQNDKNISLRLARAATACSMVLNNCGEKSISGQYKTKSTELYNSIPYNQKMESLYAGYFIRKNKETKSMLLALNL